MQVCSELLRGRSRLFQSLSDSLGATRAGRGRREANPLTRLHTRPRDPRAARVSPLLLPQRETVGDDVPIVGVRVRRRTRLRFDM